MIGQRKKLLPGEVSEQGNLPEKSAEVIVVTGNEPASVSHQIVGGLTEITKD